MNRDQIEGGLRHLKGRGQTAFGAVAGRARPQAEGAVNQVLGGAQYAYGRGRAVYEAVGATRTFETTPYPSTHNLGTNRMSENPRDGVVDRFERQGFERVRPIGKTKWVVRKRVRRRAERKRPTLAIGLFD